MQKIGVVKNHSFKTSIQNISILVEARKPKNLQKPDPIHVRDILQRIWLNQYFL